MYRSRTFCSTLNTKVFTPLGMCKVFTDAVHCVALWTRTLSKLWACVRYVLKQNFCSTLNTKVITAFGMCKVCTEAAHSIALRSTKTPGLNMWKHENAKTGGINLWTRKRKNAKIRKRRKRENGENPKTAKTRKPENGESRKAVFASSKLLQSIKLAIKDARRWEQRETRKRENGQKRSRFLVFWFSRFAGRILLARSRFYVLSICEQLVFFTCSP